MVFVPHVLFQWQLLALYGLAHSSHPIHAQRYSCSHLGYCYSHSPLDGSPEFAGDSRLNGTFGYPSKRRYGLVADGLLMARCPEPGYLAQMQTAQSHRRSSSAYGTGSKYRPWSLVPAQLPRRWLDLTTRKQRSSDP